MVSVVTVNRALDMIRGISCLNEKMGTDGPASPIQVLKGFEVSFTLEVIFKGVKSFINQTPVKIA